MRLCSTLIIALACCGCQQSWVTKKTNLMNRTVPDLYYEQVLDNVALAMANPVSMPYFGIPTQSTTANTRQLQAGFTPQWDFLLTGSSLIRHWFFDHQSAAFTGTHIDAQTYQITPLTDPDKMVLLGEVFHLVAGNYLVDPTNDPLATYYCFHQKTPPDCKVICPCVSCPPVPFPPKDTPAPTAAAEPIPAPTMSFKNVRLDSVDEAGNPIDPAVLVAVNKALDDAKAALSEPRFVAALAEDTAIPSNSGCHPCDSWTYTDYSKLLQQILAKGGWSQHVVHRKKDVPKHACYVGHSCDVYVWADETNMADLRDLTLVVLDITSADLNSLDNLDTHGSSSKKANVKKALVERKQVIVGNLAIQFLSSEKDRFATKNGEKAAQQLQRQVAILKAKVDASAANAAMYENLAKAESADAPSPRRAPRVGPGFPFPAPPAPPAVSP